MMWSWVLTAVGVTGLYLAERKVWWVWFVGLEAQVLWLAYAVATRQWGWVYARNARLWAASRDSGADR